MKKALFLTLVTTACITPEKKDDDGDQTSGLTIMDIQQGNVEEDTTVTLTDVLVSTPLTLEGEGFFVQDPAGGEYSGMYVYLQGSFTDLFLSVGDHPDLSGRGIGTRKSRGDVGVHETRVGIHGA